MPTLVQIQPPPPVVGLLGGRISGCSSMVEQQPSKLKMRVRSPSPAPSKIGSNFITVNNGLISGEKYYGKRKV
tara:strand:+ start:695 stop:913 length:219 start_codon:yes stop_codon:yes gene_type:complete